MLRIVAALVFVAASALAQQQPSKLAVTDAVIHQFEDGPPIPGSHSFLTGESVWVSTRFSGYRRSENNRLLLRWQVDVFDPQGVLLVETRTDTVDVELAPQDKQWMPKVRHDFLNSAAGRSGYVQTRHHRA